MQNDGQNKMCEEQEWTIPESIWFSSSKIINKIERLLKFEDQLTSFKNYKQKLKVNWTETVMTCSKVSSVLSTAISGKYPPN